MACLVVVMTSCSGEGLAPSTGPPPSPPTRSTLGFAAPSEDGRCRSQLVAGPDGPESAVEVALELIDRARVDDRRCPPLSPARRVCRAIWVAATLDPVLLWASEAVPPVRRQAAAALDWALSDAVAAVGDQVGPLALALDRLREVDNQLAALLEGERTEEGLVVQLIDARALDAVIDPITAAEAACAMSLERTDD